MPGKRMRYSGLITKTRAMSGKLLTKEQLMQLTELATVNEAINFLKETESYGPIYRGNDGIWHRGQAEAVIINSLFRDFEKLYQFSDAGQRPAFRFVFLRYETDMIKKYLKGLLKEGGQKPEEKPDVFFYKHACFSIERLQNAATLQEFEQCLKGTPYERLFAWLGHSQTSRYADYAMQLDINYYAGVFKAAKRMKKSDLRQVLLEIYGTQSDWLNIMWIYRSKRFYSQTQAELYASLIPNTYRLKKEEQDRLIAAQDLGEMNKILENTGYFKGKDAFVEMEDELSYRKILGAAYQRVSRKYPISIAPVLKYLYEKEQEIQYLTTIIEGIRYQVPPKDIKDMILITI